MTLSRAIQFRDAIAAVDAKLAEAILRIVPMLRERHTRHPHSPRDALLREAKRIWIQDFPSFGSLGIEDCFVAHKRLRLSEVRCVACTAQEAWAKQEGAPLAVALVRLELVAKPDGALSFGTTLLELLPLASMIAPWFGEHPEAGDADCIAWLAGRLAGLHEVRR